MAHDPYPPIHHTRYSDYRQKILPLQHTSARLTILNVLSSPKHLLLGMHSLNVRSLASHWMHSRRHCHWGNRYQASVFEHTNLSCFSPPTYFNTAFILRFYLSFILLYLLHCIFSFLLIYHVQTPAISVTHGGMQ